MRGRLAGTNIGTEEGAKSLDKSDLIVQTRSIGIIKTLSTSSRQA